MAAAGARVGETATLTGGRTEHAVSAAGERTERAGVPPARRSPRIVDLAAALALLAAGGTALAFFIQHTGNAERTDAAPSATPSQSRAVTASPASPASSASSAASASSAPSASAAPVHQAASALPVTPQSSPAATSLEIAGVGCPSGGGTVTFNNAPKGPGWTSAGGGWTGNGCDGSTLWTMDPNGKQPVPSTLTWSFSAPGASRCTLAVYVPTQNAEGVSDYSVSVGPAAASQVVSAMPVSQSAMAGQWLTLGSFPVSGSQLEITTAPAPGASGPGHHGAIAASAARAACTS